MAADSKMTRLQDGVIQQIRDLFPQFKTSQRSLVLKDIWAEDTLDKNDIKSQLQVKDNEGTWGVPIKAKVELVDNVTGKAIGKPATIQICKVPKLTNRLSFIVDGGEYQVDHLLRLKSGIYTRADRTGALKTEFNLRKGGNKNFDLTLDRKSSVFHFSPKKSKAHVPVYPLMKIMGVSDDELVQHWGKELYAANKVSDPEVTERALRKFWEATKGKEQEGNPSLDQIRQHVYDYFDQTELFPDTTKVTLGQAFDKVTGKALVAASNKLLKLERKEVLPDDRDSLVFKEVVHVEDVIPEKIGRAKHAIISKVRMTLNHKNNVSEILGGGDVFNRQIKDFFTKGGNLSERSEQTNPVQMLSGNFKTTIVAKDYGGIKNTKELGEDMQAINPSHFGFLDPMHTPESERTGITLHLGSGVFKDGSQLKTTVYDLKGKKNHDASVAEFHKATVVLADQVTWKDGKPIPISKVVKVKLPDGDIGHKEFHEADYVMPSAKSMFSYASNLIPFLPCDQGNRASMADKQMEQAISLKHRETPHVQSVLDPKTGKAFEQSIGSAFAATRATVSGKVTHVTKDAVHVHDGKKTHEIPIYNHFPLNDPTAMLHSIVTVKPGDEVKAGQVVADSNFTKGGTLALGANMRVGYLPYKGYNFEDGIVISQSAAKKLTSEHLHKLKLDIDPDGDVTNKTKWKAHSSRKVAEMSKDQLDLLDEHGVIKEGVRIMPGQVLATCLTPNLNRSKEMLKRFQNRGVKPWKDKSLVWDGDHPGIVTRVVKSPNGKAVKVFVKTEEPVVIGDKLSGRHGNKGIVTKILPDHAMPFTKHGDETRHLDVLLNPSGVPTRINVGQVLETAAAKIAEKTGKPYLVNNFAGAGHDYGKQVMEDLKKHGLTDEEHVFDPEDPKRPLGSVLVGPQYLLKLKHQVEKKLAVRGAETDLQGRQYKYDVDRQPLKGGSQGAQGFGALELYSLLGHNARHNLREMATYKSDMQSPDFWQLVSEGREPPPPKVPFAYHKFEGLLKGLGVDVVKNGTSMQMVPMTNERILSMAGNGANEVKKPLLVFSKTMKPEKGGFFDPIITGGLDGTKWSYLKICEPLPNPVFVGDSQLKGPIPSLLSLKHGDVSVDDIDKIVAGHKSLGGKTGGAAIHEALGQIDVDWAIKEVRERLAGKRGSKKDQANRTLKYLLALKEHGLKPADAYVLKYLPIVPPQFRPVSPTQRGDIAKSSLNDLYRNFGVVNERLSAMPASKFGEKINNTLRADLWNSLKALQSVGNYHPVFDKDSFEKRPLKGIIDIVGSGEGEQPKEGYFQSKLVKRKHDLSIRSTIVPEPSLHLDEVGIPGHAAMELYKPFVVAHMTNHLGYKQHEALAEMQKGPDSAVATKALNEVMADRPLIIKRDPALHKFNVMAFRPKVVEGKAIKIHPLVCGGFNADFDGDTMAGTVPVSREAVEEAKGMFPTKNLFSPTTFKPVYTPSQEFLLGLHLASKWGHDTKKTFNTVHDLAAAADKGEVKHTDVVRVKGFDQPTTYGRILIESKLPRGFAMSKTILHDPTFEVKKKTMGKIIEEVARNHSEHFSDTSNLLKDLGTERAFREGFSIGLKDFRPIPQRDGIIAKAQKQVDALKKSNKDQWQKAEAIRNVWADATKEIEKATEEHASTSGSRLGTMVFSGARGKSEQLRQMVAAPMLVHNAKNEVVLQPITKSYGEGLDVGDYWLAQHGARKGTLQRASGTREPGSMTKDIINSTISNLIVSEDCGTEHGISLSLDHEDVHDRFLARGYDHFKAGTQLTPAVVDQLKKILGKDKKIEVRSPLKCIHGEGLCAKCFGVSENGKLHAVGTNIGILAGQALGEPATQLAMDAFHTGGVAGGRGGSSVSRIQHLKDLLKMPARLKGSAVLSKVEGPIQSITPNKALGGHDIVISGVRHHVRAGDLHPEMKVGVSVTKGQSLSPDHARKNPKELLAVTKDMHEVQRYLTNELYDRLYKDQGVRQRNVEMVVRGLTNYSRVKDPGTSHWEVGDVVPHSVLEEHNRNVRTSGTEKPVSHEPVLHGSGTIPRLSTDWMARLNYQQLGRTIQQAASSSWKSDIHGNHPVPGLAYGAEFGPYPKTPPGKPKHVY